MVSAERVPGSIARLPASGHGPTALSRRPVRAPVPVVTEGTMQCMAGNASIVRSYCNVL